MLSFLHAENTTQTIEDGEGEMMKRIVEKAHHPMASSYQDKKYSVGGIFSDKTFSTKCHFAQLCNAKSYSTGGYPTHSFFGIPNNWIGKKMCIEPKTSFPLLKDHELETKSYPNKNFETHSYTSGKKKASASTDQLFETHPAIFKAKAQGSLDHDQGLHLKLQEALKKGLSVDDVRKLLNKGEKNE
ncbi:MAG TPA: hypothetical protein VJK54_11300 [Chthoniobacterales bacterium]|nr:hypothetical protein [Chthoniobacterales bacterium]